MNPLAIFNPKFKRQQELKAKILKNKEAVLDIMSSKIEGARQCPLLCGAKCLGQFCELFMELKSIDKDGKETPFWRCAILETPLLLIELNTNIRNLLLTKEKK